MNDSNRPAKPSKSALPSGYAAVLAEVTRMIGDSRRRALASVNRELVRLYWEMGRVIVAQQEKAAWGDSVVERFAADLRAAFPDMKGLMSANLWRMRQLYLSCREVDAWLRRTHLDGETGTVSRQDQPPARRGKGVVRRLSPVVSVLEESHTERQLRRAMLANLRELFLELGRDFTFVGEEYPVIAGDDTFRVDLLFFHRRLQCLVAIELKTGKFKPEYVGKCQFYLAALDEQVRLPHEKPSVGLILCKSANGVQMRLALTAAARKIGVATYQTALPEERLILQRLRQLPDQQAPVPSSIPSGGNER